MIKGINHKVIEVTDTESIYYERAYLLVRPEYEEAEEAVLRKEAKKLLSDVGTPSSIKGKRTFLYWFLRTVPLVIAGIGAGVLIGILF
ncbi:MAG: hypothetical protein IKK10_00055 [Clostridia bacterium]|nr:hypothetical protein [Clostridia bacterium]